MEDLRCKHEWISYVYFTIHTKLSQCVYKMCIKMRIPGHINIIPDMNCMSNIRLLSPFANLLGWEKITDEMWRSTKIYRNRGNSQQFR